MTNQGTQQGFFLIEGNFVRNDSAKLSDSDISVEGALFNPTSTTDNTTDNYLTCSLGCVRRLNASS